MLKAERRDPSLSRVLSAGRARLPRESQKPQGRLTRLQDKPRRTRCRLSHRFVLALAVIAVVAMVWAPAHPALAADGSIEVLSESGSVEFPNGLSFSLTAQGSADIVEIRFLHRLRGSSVWSYAYPDFSPGPSVRASLNISVAGSEYLPPGAELEYYYVLGDVQGNVHQTRPNVIEYADHRFHWERAQIGGLQLLYHELPQSHVAAASQSVESRLAYVLELLGVDSFRPVKGVIYNSHAEARQAFPHISRTIAEARVFGGYAFPSSGVFVAIGFRPGIIVHETAHLLLDQALGRYALPLPAWLNEGFASYVEPGSRPHSGTRLSPGSLPLSSMNSVSGTPDEIPKFYHKAESVVAFMINTYGVERFQRLLNKLSDGRPVEEAMVETYGFGVSDLDSRWSSDGGEPASPQPGSHRSSFPWVNFSGLVLGALAIVVFTAVAARYAVRRLRSTENPEDRLQPWEDPDLMEEYDEP